MTSEEIALRSGLNRLALFVFVALVISCAAFALGVLNLACLVLTAN